jgi:hypothetical protein
MRKDGGHLKHCMSLRGGAWGTCILPSMLHGFSSFLDNSGMVLGKSGIILDNISRSLKKM